ncbi:MULTISPECIES: signal peptidase II [unclassified Microbacterium]|uniref:signal peptidase II n=1 Tax=unclassified Microbacterium TaxID=2609290 RepID=UPI00214C44FC|nr:MULTISPECIES: signal peptidase II [unclassified Microbacterium]MCR2785871.1 signal peptidase II [Microbacterium sp. zg.B96]WIM17152.1 signal peptidase II [Microbacterium sp. zg-B96]
MTGRTPLRTAAAGTITAILAVAVLAADQFTKYLALENLPYQETVPVFGEALQLYLTRNPGAAFSLGEGVTWIFTIVLAAAAVTIVVLTVRVVRSRWWAVVLGLLLGGILGNLTDRLFREPGFLVGHVVDFIHTPWMWLGLPSAIYNVADIFIVTMMLSVAVLVLIGMRFDGTREKHTAEADPASGAVDASAPDEAAKA